MWFQYFVVCTVITILLLYLTWEKILLVLLPVYPCKFITCGVENYLTSSGYYLHRERLGIFLGIVFVSLSLRQVEGWMSLSHGLNGPPSTWITADRLEIALEEQHHTVHHTLAVDPTPGEKIPGRPASLFGRSDRFKLVVAPTDVARRNIGRSIKSRWIKRLAGLREAGRPDFFTPRAHSSHGS